VLAHAPIPGGGFTDITEGTISYKLATQRRRSYFGRPNPPPF
jgi:hypothetical protein